MTGPNFTKQVSLGNALQIVAMLIAVGVAYAQLDSRVTSVDERSRQNYQLIQQMQPQISAVQRSEARTDARLQSIETGLSRIEAGLSELSRYLRDSGRGTP